jgi:hypothetical protein
MRTTYYTKGQIERALQTVSRTRSALTYKHAFVCDQCNKIALWIGEGPVLRPPALGE